MTTRKGTTWSPMLQQINISILNIAAYLSALLSCLSVTSTIAGTTSTLPVLLLLFVSPQTLGCPPSCECINTTVLDVSCKNGRLLSIFTNLDNLTYTLSLDNVVDLQVITGDLIRDLTAPEIVQLQITASSVKRIEENAFLKLTHLENLDLSRNDLATIHENSFGGLDDLKSLNLSHNHLATIGHSLSLLPKLVTLDLSSNYLKDFLPGAFSSQNSLTFLKLDGNPLRKLQGSSFQGLLSVRQFSARDCSLAQVEDGVFSGMPALTVVDLGQNRLSTIPDPSIMSKLILLRAVFLDNNDFQTLQQNAFKDVQLQMLDLSYNRINKIDPLAFERAIFENLDLSSNLIISLTQDVLKPLGKHITKLNLAGNPLQSLDKHVFEDLELLETLNISSCSLETLEYDSFQSLSVLRNLDISHNSLHFLPQRLLVDLFDKLYTVSFHANSWVCDCHIKYLRDWLTLASSVSKVQCPLSHEEHRDCTNLRCSSPPDLQNSQIMRLEDKEVAKCKHEKSTVLPASIQGAIVASCLACHYFVDYNNHLVAEGPYTQRIKESVCTISSRELSYC